MVKKSPVDEVIDSGSALGGYIMIGTAIVTGLIGVVLFGLSMYFFFKPKSDYKTLEGIVKNASCQALTTGSRSTSSKIHCALELEFTDPTTGQKMTRFLNTSGKKTYLTNQNVKLQYENDDLSTLRVCCAANKNFVGAVLLLVSLVMFGVAAFHWFLRKNKAASLFTTAGTFFGN